MAETDRVELWAGDTEPLTFTFSLTASESLATGNVSSVKLYAREANAATNEVDGVALTSVSVSSTDNGDGTYAVSGSGIFDPAGSGPDSTDAFNDAGTFRCYLTVTWDDGDQTRHPAPDQGALWITAKANYE